MVILEKIRVKSKNPAEDSPIKIAFLGDSVTHGCFEIIDKGDGRIDCVYDHEAVYHNRLKQKIEKVFPNVDRPNNAIYFRRKFCVVGEVKYATAYVCGIGYHQITLNGELLTNAVLVYITWCLRATISISCLPAGEVHRLQASSTRCMQSKNTAKPAGYRPMTVHLYLVEAGRYFGTIIKQT